MEYFKDFANIEITLRNMLIKQSELEEKRVLNGRSFRGIDLNKVITEDEEFSISLNDLFIIFNIYNSDNLNFSEEIDENNIRLTSSFTLHVTIYGTNSIDLSQKLKARLSSLQVALELKKEGLYIKKVYDPTDVTEYINDTFWERYDLEVDVIGERVISKVESDYIIKEIEVITDSQNSEYTTNIKN